MVKVGERAPNIALPDTERKTVRLSDFQGKKVVLALYPGAFTKVCERELCTFRNSLAKLEALQSQVIGISVDSPFSKGAFAAVDRLPFLLLSDYTREASRRCAGVHEDFLGLKRYAVFKRAVFVFVVDKGGIVRYAWVSENPGMEPPYAEIQAVLATI